VAYLFNNKSAVSFMPKARRKGRGRAKAKVVFFGHEILLTFVGSLIIALGVFIVVSGLEPMMLNWIFSAVVIWLGLLIFLLPIVRIIEGSM
jgi:hypothetical protein